MSKNPFSFLQNPFLQSMPSTPMIDMSTLFATGRRNMEALSQAQKIMFECAQALGTRQSQMMREIMNDMTKVSREMMVEPSVNGQASRQTQQSKKALEGAISNARELAEIMTQSNREACDILNCRLAETLEEISRLMQPGASTSSVATARPKAPAAPSSASKKKVTPAKKKAKAKRAPTKKTAKKAAEKTEAKKAPAKKRKTSSQRKSAARKAVALRKAKKAAAVKVKKAAKPKSAKPTVKKATTSKAVVKSTTKKSVKVKTKTARKTASKVKAKVKKATPKKPAMRAVAANATGVSAAIQKPKVVVSNK